MFSLQVVSNTPMNSVQDLDIVAETFLTEIGYLPKGYDPKTSATSIKESVPYRLFMEFFMANPNKPWTIDELTVLLDTTRPTIYRHINKLKSLDLMEGVNTEYEDKNRKGYRIRYGDLAKAWSFTEANVKMAMDNYKNTVTHLQKLSEERRESDDRI